MSARMEDHPDLRGGGTRTAGSLFGCSGVGPARSGSAAVWLRPAGADCWRAQSVEVEQVCLLRSWRAGSAPGDGREDHARPAGRWCGGMVGLWVWREHVVLRPIGQQVWAHVDRGPGVGALGLAHARSPLLETHMC